MAYCTVTDKTFMALGGNLPEDTELKFPLETARRKLEDQILSSQLYNQVQPGDVTLAVDSPTASSLRSAIAIWFWVMAEYLKPGITISG